MKILITGGCGFVGSNLAVYLKKKILNVQIHTLDNLSRRGSIINYRRLKKYNIKNYRYNIDDYNRINQIPKHNLIIDCCAEPAVEVSKSEVDRVFNTNLVGTFNVLKKCSKDMKKNAKKSASCEKLYLQTFQVLDSTKIKSITFDYKAGYEAVKNNDRLKQLKWHTWHVDSIKAFEDLIRRDNTGIILLKNNKHLDNLN